MSSDNLNIICYANQFADREGHGQARYARQLFQSLRSCPGISPTPVAAWTSCEKQEFEQLKREFGIHLLPWGRKLTPLAWTFAGFPPVEHWMDDRVDIVHAFTPDYPIATRKPFVVTVHDIGPLTHPEFFNNRPQWIMKRSIGQMINKADAIICVSQATSDDLLNYAGRKLNEDRVHIIGEGVSPVFFSDGNEQCLTGLSHMPKAGTPFILSTGKISPRKNIQGVIEALSLILDDIPHHLVLVGGSGWEMDQVHAQLNTPRLAERVHMVGYVSDEQLITLYKAASAYVHPSLFEGFGLTLLEAMAAGCPVITSNVFSLPEVAGDAALLVNPHDAREIANAIKSVCLDTSISNGLIRMGRDRVAYFSWDEAARKLADVYHQIT